MIGRFADRIRLAHVHHILPPDFARSALDQTPVQSPDERDVSRQLSIDQSPPPGHVPGYEIERQLGEGSFGSVWLARVEDRQAGRDQVLHAPPRA
ncbi:MAG: hypothetical protein R3B90_03945 [Planctomycetaceae bacterium]